MVFLKILQKNFEISFWGTLGMSGYFHQETIIQLVEVLIFNSIPNFFFEIL